MTTKLTRYCEGLMEAVWLAALIVIPIFFNIYSSRIFEPDKTAILRSLALLTLGAWVVKIVDQGEMGWGFLQENEQGWFRGLLKIPMMPQVLALVIVYFVATLISVTPRVSFWGSYQRLQGTYTTLSYIVIFASVLGNMRRRAQVDRLITTAILASLPVGLYGILQRFEIDPIPWGGDTAKRVAANMGNAIFVAAYLIMAIPLAIGRIVDSFTKILKEEEENLTPQVARGTVYVFILAIDLITVYYSFSRGPILGLLAGAFFLFLLLSLYWNARWLTITIVGAAAALGGFLLVLSLPNSPLEALKSSTGLGRLGNVFEVERGTGRVRVLIWEGASELVWFHEPLKFPDGDTDIANPIRPFLGYGPESMYVAYNPFYPPELANIEARNASPDRSHNETWDSLVITGLIGLAAEQLLFVSLFYFGLKWLGMVVNPRQRRLLLTLYFGAGLVSAVVFWNVLGIGWIGVGFPFGALIGLLVYLGLIAVFTTYETPRTDGARLRSLTLMMLLGAVIAHYVEIHFGIAIVATRTYFWIYTGALVAVGFVMTRLGVYGDLKSTEMLAENSSRRGAAPPAKKSKRSRAASKKRSVGTSSLQDWQQHAIAGGILTGITFLTLSFNYISNPNRSESVIQIFWSSLTRLVTQNDAISFGILAIFITLLLAAVVAFTSEYSKERASAWWQMGLWVLLIGLGMGLFYALWQANNLANVIQLGGTLGGIEGVLAQAGALEGIFTQYYAFLFIAILVLGRYLASEWPTQLAGRSGGGLLTAFIALAIVLIFTRTANLRVIHADVAFKIAEPFGRGDDPNSWRAAITLYQRANDFVPTQDHYYLFLGRGYLELARLLQAENPEETQALMTQAETDLKRAQRINPLNTDHTANLARLNRFRSSFARQTNGPWQEFAQQSSDYYASALELSPNNSVIWNEWATLNLELLNAPERAVKLLKISTEVDPFYDATYAILGDFYARQANTTSDPDEREEAVRSAIESYAAAYERTKSGNTSARYSYLAAQGGLYAENGQLDEALIYYFQALDLAEVSQRWRVEQVIANVYAEMGDYQNAIVHGENALGLAPPEQQSSIQAIIARWEAQEP